MKLLARDTGGLVPAFAFGVIALLAIAQRHFVAANADVAALLTIAEKMLDGQRLYVDVVEPNSAFSVWLNLPAILLARLLGVRAETALDAMILLLAAASIWLAHRLLSASYIGAQRVWLPVATFAVLVLLPGMTFAEREHIALILFVPVLALAVRRAAGGFVSFDNAMIAGVCGGIALCVKPHFALALAGAVLASAVAQRTWRLFFTPEHWIAGGLFCAFLGSSFWLYPAYWSDIIPLVQLVYLPVRAPVMKMLNGGMPFLILELLVIAFLVTAGRINALRGPRVSVMLFSIVGFIAAALIQGKGWLYHFLPAFGLIVILLTGVGLARLADAAAMRLPISFRALASAGLLSLQFWLWFNSSIDMSVIEAPLRAIKQNPRVIALVSDFAVAFPAVRNVDGESLGHSLSRWVPYNAAGIAAQDNFDRSLLPALRQADESDRRQLVADIVKGRPDVLLVERLPFDFLEWARRDRELAGLMTCFRAIQSVRVGRGVTNGEGFDIEFYAAEGRTPSVGGCAP